MDGTFEVLNRMVGAGVISRYAIAVGALNYLEPMTTRDVDILVSVADLGPARSGLLTRAHLLVPATSWLHGI